MVEKYLIFDRFDFLCRFFSRFLNNDFFLVVRNLRVLHRISPYDKLRVLIINKDVRKSLARKNGNESPIWSWNDSPGKSHKLALNIYVPTIDMNVSRQ